MKRILLLSLLIAGCDTESSRVDIDRWWTSVKQEERWQRQLIQTCFDRGGIPYTEWETHKAPWMDYKHQWHPQRTIRMYRNCAFPPPSPIISSPVEK